MLRTPQQILQEYLDGIEEIDLEPFKTKKLSNRDMKENSVILYNINRQKLMFISAIRTIDLLFKPFPAKKTKEVKLSIKTERKTSVVFENKALSKVFDIAILKGYRVYSFSSSAYRKRPDKKIKELIIENKDGLIGRISVSGTGISFITIHRKNSTDGDGFGKLIKRQIVNKPSDLDIAFSHTPYWNKGAEGVVKYKSFKDYADSSIGGLTFYEII